MSLPTSLRTSIAPSELELVATQQLIEIVPLVSMERTVFISVRNRMPHFVSLKQMQTRSCESCYRPFHKPWKFSSIAVRLMRGVYGPFRPPNKTSVPLWIAINLKQKRKCHILAPSWFTVGACCFAPSDLLLEPTLPLPEYLQECLALETSNPAFTELPFRYMEISKVLLDVFASFWFSLATSILMQSLSYLQCFGWSRKPGQAALLVEGPSWGTSG